MKACHPDLSGDDPETTNFCMFINEVYEVGASQFDNPCVFSGTSISNHYNTVDS